MKRRELIDKYIEFFKKKNHKEIGNSSLIPENDPTVLFTTAGMHPLVPFLLGQRHPQGKRLVNVQRCIRTGDIDEVGDEFHHTFFEMLGNWSLGDYWKEEAIEMTFEFCTKTLKIPLERLAVTCFLGDKDAEKDTESEAVWIKLGIPKERVAFLPKKENFWGPAGKTGPCGPNTEIFYWSGSSKTPKRFDPENKSWVEIGNDVLLEFNKDEKGKYTQLKQKNIDFGGGVERTLAVLNNLKDDYLSECFYPCIQEIEKLSKKKYGKDKEVTRAMRIIADHIKASVFILSEGIVPGNSEQGYVLRRLIRRAIRFGKKIGIEGKFTSKLAEKYFDLYPEYKLEDKNKFIFSELNKEEERFEKLLVSGLKYFNKISKGKKQISGWESFLLYQSYGFPYEITEDLAREKKIKISKGDFEKEYVKHQELSRKKSSGRFKSGLADYSKDTTKLHTATHLLNEALRVVLKDKKISQRGSNITPERLRFDFNFPRKLSDKEIKDVENLVNEKIREKLPVRCEEMSLEEARKKNARAEFGDKYGGKVFVYSIGNFSKEVCAGPHVKNTGELGEGGKKFKIKKEEGVAAGVRRIKGELVGDRK